MQPRRLLLGALIAAYLLTGCSAEAPAGEAAAPRSFYVEPVDVDADGNPKAPSELPKELEQALWEGTSYELYMLDGDPGATPDGRRLYEWPVIDSTVVTDPDTRLQLNEALRRGVRESDGSVAACFEPGHAVRVEHQEATWDVVICFACSHARVYRDGETQPMAFTLTESPYPVFESVLNKAGISR